MNSNEMTDLVIKQLTVLKCPPIAKAMSISKDNKEKAYKLLTEKPKITLKQYLEEMGLKAE